MVSQLGLIHHREDSYCFEKHCYTFKNAVFIHTRQKHQQLSFIATIIMKYQKAGGLPDSAAHQNSI